MQAIGEGSERVFKSTISRFQSNTSTEGLKKLGCGGSADAGTLEDAGCKSERGVCQSP